MNAGDGRARWEVGHVDDQVADLSPEDIGCTVAQVAGVLVRVGLDQADVSALGGKVGRRSDGRQAVRVSNHLSIVIVDDGGRDQVCARGEVNHRRGGGRRRARARSASVASGDGGVDGGGVVGHTITFGTEIHDITENLVAAGSGVESCNTLMFDVFHPVIARASGRRFF